MFALDATDISKWDTVEELAASVLESVIKGTPCPVEPLAQDFKEEDVKTTNHCTVCDRVFVSTNQWKSTCRCNNNSDVRGLSRGLSVDPRSRVRAIELFSRFFMDLERFWWILMGFEGSWRVLEGFEGPWWVLMDLEGFWWVLMGFDGVWWVLKGSDGSWRVLMDSDGFWWGFFSRKKNFVKFFL